jgi:glucosamine--fructose-6-phosphate aminotransferase (isomerizing)
MIDEKVRTPVIFILLEDEHKSQVLSNILQVKERGATSIVLTNIAKVSELIDLAKIDYLIELQSCVGLFSSLQACVPLQMIVYYTAMAKGINPDNQIFDALNYDHELDL